MGSFGEQAAGSVAFCPAIVSSGKDHLSAWFMVGREGGRRGGKRVQDGEAGFAACAELCITIATL